MYDTKYGEINATITYLEEKFATLQESNAEISDKFKILQNITVERDQCADRLTTFISIGEKLYSDTSAAGREVIRKDLRDIRER